MYTRAACPGQYGRINFPSSSAPDMEENPRGVDAQWMKHIGQTLQKTEDSWIGRGADNIQMGESLLVPKKGKEQMAIIRLGLGQTA